MVSNTAHATLIVNSKLSILWSPSVLTMSHDNLEIAGSMPGCVHSIRPQSLCSLPKSARTPCGVCAKSVDCAQSTQTGCGLHRTGSDLWRSVNYWMWGNWKSRWHVQLVFFMGFSLFLLCMWLITLSSVWLCAIKRILALISL